MRLLKFAASRHGQPLSCILRARLRTVSQHHSFPLCAQNSCTLHTPVAHVDKRKSLRPAHNLMAMEARHRICDRPAQPVHCH